MRRVHESLAGEVERRLVQAYEQVNIDNPLSDQSLRGPLITPKAMEDMAASLDAAKAVGGEVIDGGGSAKLDGKEAGGNFVKPAIVRAKNDYEIVQSETFAPVLYLITIKDVDDATPSASCRLPGRTAASPM